MTLIEEAKKENTKGACPSVLDAICQRRAIRHYKAQAVDQKTIWTLLEFAVQAPSAVNSQPWSFAVVQDPVLLRNISNEAKKGLAQDPRWKSEAQHESNRFLDPGFNIFYGASTLIIVCATQEGLAPEADCYLACQNLMLAAYGMGLGTCPIGLAWDVLRTEAMKRKLGIPDGHFPVLPIIVGYPSEESPRTPRNPPKVLNWISA
jgi:nitroreductase